MKIICHPVNYQWLREELAKNQNKEVQRVKQLVPAWALQKGVEIIQDTSLPVFKETDKYQLINGQIQEKEEIHYVRGFCTYGPEDLDFLLYAGIAVPHKERVFYKIEESNFDPMLMYSPFGSNLFFNSYH